MDSRPWTRNYDYCVPETLRYPRIPISDIIAIPSSAFPDKVATDFFGSEITFYELRKQSVRMMNVLGGLGVKKGDRVGLHLPTCPQYVISFYAITGLGGIVVNLNPLYTPAELEALAEDTGLKALITFDMVLPNIRTLCQSVEIDTVIVTAITDFINGMPRATAASLELQEGWHHFSTLLDGCTSLQMPRRGEVSPDDPAVLQFTGGTTGTPKGAILTHANLVAATLQCTAWGSPLNALDPPQRRRVLGILPLFHAYGNVVVMNWAMFNCATMILVPRFELDEIMNTISRFDKISFFPCVPTVINALINHPRAGELDLGKRLGLLNSGAAPMATELIDQVVSMGIPFGEGWGMSETTSLGISNPILGMKKTGSIGIPFPDTDVKLVDVNDGITEVKKGEPGEIMIKSPLVMQGYWNKPEETAEQLKEGWLYTGDIAMQDEDDYFFIVDRKKDMVIAGGYNIYPREIDEVLYQHPKIADAVAVGIADEYRGETIKAYVVLKEGESCTDEEIIGFCRQKLAAYKAPKLVEFRRELPKSAVGKILRKVLRQEEEEKKKG
jgi:long-chain acyl-CoA synthetase